MTMPEWLRRRVTLYRVPVDVTAFGDCTDSYSLGKLRTRVFGIRVPARLGCWLAGVPRLR